MDLQPDIEAAAYVRKVYDLGVTVYQPDLEEWEPGFRRRRKP